MEAIVLMGDNCHWATDQVLSWGDSQLIRGLRVEYLARGVNLPRLRECA